MKILWLSHLVPYPPKAGVLLRAHYLVKELAKFHEVHLIAFNQRNLIEPYFDSYSAGTEQAKAVLTQICQKIHFIDCPTDKSQFSKLQCAASSLFSPLPYTINWLRDKEFAHTVQQWHKDEMYDLIHCDTISLAPYVDSIRSAILSLDHHNVESHMLERRAGLEKNLPKKLYFWQESQKLKAYEKKICPIFHTNLCCSELDKKRFQQFVPNASFTEIPNGVDTEIFTPGDCPPDSASFIFIGTLDWYPNTRAVRYLAQNIWPKLKAAIPNATINIIGSGAPDDLIEFGLNNKGFNMLGFVDDLKPWLDKATAYLCPIDDGGGTKLKLLDAFAAGKAVIAHSVAAEGLKAVDGEHLLLADCPEDYIKYIELLIKNTSLREKLQKNARQHALNSFSFDAIGKNLAGHFSHLQDDSGLIK